MRTTVTLDPDVEALVRKSMRQSKVSFKQALNDALRRGLTGGGRRAQVSTPTFSMGTPVVPLDHALRVAADLEDAEIQRKLTTDR